MASRLQSHLLGSLPCPLLLLCVHLIPAGGAQRSLYLDGAPISTTWGGDVPGVERSGNLSQAHSALGLYALNDWKQLIATLVSFIRSELPRSGGNLGPPLSRYAPAS